MVFYLGERFTSNFDFVIFLFHIRRFMQIDKVYFRLFPLQSLVSAGCWFRSGCLCLACAWVFSRIFAVFVSYVPVAWCPVSLLSVMPRLRFVLDVCCCSAAGLKMVILEVRLLFVCCAPYISRCSFHGDVATLCFCGGSSTLPAGGRFHRPYERWVGSGYWAG